MYQKRKISIMVLVILILQIVFPILAVVCESELTSKSIAAGWKTATVDGITWQYYLDEGVITKLIPGNEEEIVNVIIPSSIDGYTVTGILQFWKCKNLESIEIPDSVTNIESKTFMDCNKLKNVVIGNGVTEIKEETFQDCVSLENIIINGNITNIGEGAFRRCSNLQSIEIPNSMTKIGEAAFAGCKKLESIEIPDSVTTIDSSAFQGCSLLKNVNLGNGVEEIKIYAFKDCKSLESIIIPNSVTNLGSSVFEGCTSLVSANIGTGETMIGVALFDGCSSLTTINIPNNIETIGNCAFRGCSSLKSINIPNSVSFIGICAFEGCSSLENINANENNQDFESNEGVLFNKGKTELVCFPAGKTIETYNIPSTVKSIGYKAFYGCYNLKSIYIPNGVSSISNSVFEGCSNLQHINFPDSISAFGVQLFSGCNKLTSIDIDENSGKFENISGVLFNKQKDRLLIYPPGKKDESYSIPNEVTTITECTFYDCDNLHSIILSNNASDIGWSAFAKCDSLETVEIPNSVQNIGHRAFENCSNLIHITLPDGLEKIENGLFWFCTNLKTVDIPESVNSIEHDAFYNCSSLDNVILPDGITSIGQEAFRGCSNMISIKLPENLNVIDYHSFYGCRELDNVILPEGLTIIGYEAFYGCIGINEITLPNSIEKIGYGAFDNSASVVYYPAEIETAVKNGTHYFKNFVIIGEEPKEISKQLTGLFITTPPTKSSYIVGENFDKTGMVVIACYNDGSKRDVTDYIVTDGENLQLDKTSVTISYTENGATYTTTMSIAQEITVKEGTIEGQSLTRIEITKAPTRTSYVAGQNFDKTGMVVTASYNDGSSKAVTNYTVTDGDNLIAGKKSVTISYIENGITKTATQNITVVAKALTGIAVTKAPTRTSYVAGQNFETAGMVVTASYNDGSNKLVTNYTVTDGNSLTEGKTSVAISYTENGVTKTTTQNITVVAKALTGIAITKVPTRTIYIAGQNFETAGMVVTASYNDGSSKAVTDYTVTNGNNLTAGKTSVTISYTEGNVTKTVVQNITVSEKLSIETHDLEEVEKDGKTYIESINPGATVKSLTEKIDTNGTVEIFKGTEKVTNVNTKLATGMTLKISLNNEQIEHTIVVTGDLNGDGEMGDIDVLRLARYRAGLDKNLTGAYLQASNIFKDDNYADDIDLLKMVRILVGLDSLTK